ncbi:MAG: hypothetical protein M3328_10055, partial [Chloroflexota bacterium]|nr:hypothetical protein [Chloroflexota bacterium]
MSKYRARMLAVSLLAGVGLLSTASAYAEAVMGVPTGLSPLARVKRTGADCTRTSVGLPPLTDLGSGTYQGYQGGLYPGGENQVPPEYRAQGQVHAQSIRPLDLQGQYDPNGRIVLLSIGMSNTTQEFSTFKQMADPYPTRNPRLTIVDGAQGGQDAIAIRDPNAPFWTIVDQRLSSAGVGPNQVQAAWLKEAIAGENRPFPTDAQGLRDALRDIVRIMQQRYPNLQIVYLASRIYAGYATTTLNPEPYAYQSGFAVKWLIEERINSADEGAWLAWGPYIWTDGLAGRSDYFTWSCVDVQSDGTHPSNSGRQKVAERLLKFLLSEP